MNIDNRAIDHIVYCVPDLDKAMDDFESLLGVRPVFGGYHVTQGTMNALLNLGNRCYLELLAADPDNLMDRDRWMGIDQLSRAQTTRWSLKSMELEEESAILRTYNPSMGDVNGGQRKTSGGDMLKWTMSMPLSSPEVEVVPFMTDWSSSSIHPTDSLVDECLLADISLSHPDPTSVMVILKQLSLRIPVSHSESPSIRIKVKCPNGIVEI